MTKLVMPKIDRKLLSKKVEVIANLKKIIKPENILDHEDQKRPFETDALSAYKQIPLAVFFPDCIERISGSFPKLPNNITLFTLPLIIFYIYQYNKN